ncbi:MAG: dTDP-4-dehydrorhamnose reductase [Vicinamibacterales bacterium]
MRRLVLIVGARGQLGQAMTERLTSDHEIVALGHDNLDASDTSAVDATVTAVCPDIVINCAAYNEVDRAEREPREALAANSWAPRALARAAAKVDATLVHFSTDFVFDGTASRPYAEDDAPNPRGVYAMSKLLGEWLAAQAPHHYVLRVESLFGGPNGRSSIDRILNGLIAGKEVRAFSDRTVSPSYVEDVVRATARLIEEGLPYGLYHCVNGGWTTWVDLARELGRIVGLPDAQITEITLADADLPVSRPRFAALSNAKLASAGIAMPTWHDALARHARSVLGHA